METLEDVLAFKKALRDSYDDKTDHSILPKVESFLQNHPDPKRAGVDTMFLKFITKKASHAMHEAEKNNATLSREMIATAAAYCEEAIRRLDEREYSKEGIEISEQDRQKMIGHLNAHASDFIENQADKSPDAATRKRLLRTAFKKLNTALAIATELNEENYVTSIYLSRANIEGKLTDIIEGPKKISWAEKETKDRRKGAEGKQKDQPNMAAQIYAYAARRQIAFADLFQEKKQEFLEEAYQDLVNATIFSTDAKFIAIRYEEKSRIAKQLSEMAEPKHIWVLNEIAYTREAIKKIEDPEKLLTAYENLVQKQLAIADNCPLTQEVLQQAYLDLEQSVKLTSQRYRQAELYTTKADIACKFFFMTNGQTKLDWLINGINDRDSAALLRGNPTEKADDYFIIAEAWRQASLLQTPEWQEFAGNAVFARKMGMELIEKIAPQKWIVECIKNARQANVLYDETKELNYARESVEYSKMVLQYYTEHPAEDRHGQIRRTAQGKVNWYRRFVQRKTSRAINSVRASKPQLNAEEHIEEGMKETWK